MECWVGNGTSVLQYSIIPSETLMLAMGDMDNAVTLGEELAAIAGLRVKLGEPLARYTSIKIGGPADYFVEVERAAALRQLLPLLKRWEIPVCFLGNGSNVLVSDRGVRGVVVRLIGEFKNVEWLEQDDHVFAEVGAAYAITRLVRQAARKGYAGLEFAEGIPGTMGGALVMNAGAYGVEFEKVIDRVDGVSADGMAMKFSRGDMVFSYRDSHLPVGMVVTAVRLRLDKDEATRVGTKLRELVTKRKSSQPAGSPNSGSMFRNPPGDHAGRLIEAAGLKGRRIGQAQIAERHANFIINLGGANAIEVRQLMDLARTAVEEQFAVRLEAEVRLLGDWTGA
jgi:UDP-N-acetylmuramate dehydrogenase